MTALRFVTPTDPAERPDTAPKPLAVELATRLVLGVTDPEVLAWVRAGLLRWLKSDGTASLSASLHLGTLRGVSGWPCAMPGCAMRRAL